MSEVADFRLATDKQGPNRQSPSCLRFIFALLIVSNFASQATALSSFERVEK